MERTGAGLLAQATVGSQKYFLLGLERHNTWSDLGGQKKIGEAAMQTAARIAFHESNGILGEVAEIAGQLRYHVIESIAHKTYRLFVCKWPFIELSVNEGETRKLEWIAVEDVFRAVSKSVLFGRVKVKGKYLRQRIVEMVSRSKAYHCFLRQHPELVTCHPMDRVITGMRGTDPTKRVGPLVVPLVVLHNVEGRISRIIAVIKSGREANDLELEDRSDLSPEFPVGIYGTISNLVQNPLSRSKLTTQERWAAWQTLQRESLIQRTQRLMLALRCSLGLLSIREANMLQHPLVG